MRPLDTAPWEENPRRVALYMTLTPRQKQVVALLGHGLTHQQVALALGIGLRTVRATAENAAQRIPGTRPARTRILLWYWGAPASAL